MTTTNTTTREYLFFTIGGFHRNGRQINLGHEFATLAEAKHEADQFDTSRSWPVVYGWRTNDAVDTVELYRPSETRRRR